MDSLGRTILGVLTIVLGAALLVVIPYYWLRHTRENPSRLVFKWLLSGLIIGFVLVPTGARLVGPSATQNSVVFGMIIVWIGGLGLAVLWTPNVVQWFASKFEALYTGGDDAPDPQPFYSIAQGLRLRGQFAEAIDAIDQQLDRFPHDATGQLLKAEIQAQNLHDLPAAAITVELFCNQPGHTPQQIWLALNSLADWHLRINRDAESALAALQIVLDRFPDSPQALQAAQRLARLQGERHLQDARDHTAVHLQPGVQNIGLLQNTDALRPAERDPEVEVAECVNRLDQHPHDVEARERLAVLYAEHYRDLDLASEQLEILLAQAGHPLKMKARWLNLLADFQVHLSGNYDQAKAALDRILALAPGAPVAELARHRINLLKLEIHGRDATRSIAMGIYEKYPGLKKGKPGNDPV